MNSDAHTDDDITAAIANEDATDETDIDEIRDLLAGVQSSFEDYWSEHMDAVEDGTLTVVHEDDDVVVFADHSGHGWNEEYSALDLDRDGRDGMLRMILSRVHHRTAKRLCDYSWSVSDPFVVRKPDSARAGEDLMERHLMWLCNECRLSTGVALDYFMVEWRGHSQSAWATRSGKSQQTVSQNVGNAKGKVVR